MIYYTAHTNTGTEQWGIAILKMGSIELTSMTGLPNGGGVAALCQRASLVHVRAPLGCINRKERETFLNP